VSFLPTSQAQQTRAQVCQSTPATDILDKTLACGCWPRRGWRSTRHGLLCSSDLVLTSIAVVHLGVALSFSASPPPRPSPKLACFSEQPLIACFITQGMAQLGRSPSLHQLKAFVDQKLSDRSRSADAKDLALLWAAIKNEHAAVDRRIACEGLVLLVRRGKTSVTEAEHHLVDLIPTAPLACLEDAISTLVQLLQLHTKALLQQSSKSQAFACPFPVRTHPLSVVVTQRPEVAATLLLHLELALVNSSNATEAHAEFVMFAPLFKFVFGSPRNYSERTSLRTELFHMLSRILSRPGAPVFSGIFELLINALPSMLTDTPDRAAQQLGFLSTLHHSTTGTLADASHAHRLLACVSELLLGSTTATKAAVHVSDAALNMVRA
jgi:hypothetical protein